MQSTNIPAKIPLPFANSAGSSYKNTIPVASQIGITNGKASLTDGFPPLTFQAISSGGIPPFGADFNGILNEITAIQQWQNAGGFFPYDSTFSTAIGGYPKGAILQAADFGGLWVSTVENNTTNPDTGGAGWVSLAFEGSQAISISTVDVTLSQIQSAYPILILSGTLTGARNLIFPSIIGEWIVQNNTSGSYTITGKTASGTGVTLTQGQSTYVYGDGTNIYFADSSKVASFNGRVGSVSLTALDVTNALGYSPVNPNQFPSYLGANGWQELPNGFILQWGISSTVFIDSTLVVNFPITFPTTTLNVQATAYYNTVSGGSGPSIGISNWTNSSVTLINDNLNAQATWLALGY